MRRNVSAISDVSREPLGQSDWMVITLDGEIDVARVQHLVQIVARDLVPTNNLIIDFSSVAFMDSAGVRWLYDTRWEVIKAAKEIRLTVPERGLVERLLTITGAQVIFTVYH